MTTTEDAKKWFTFICYKLNEIEVTCGKVLEKETFQNTEPFICIEQFFFLQTRIVISI